MLSTGIIRPSFIVAIICSKTASSRHNDPKVMSSEISYTANLAAEIEQIPSSVSGRKADHL